MWEKKNNFVFIIYLPVTSLELNIVDQYDYNLHLGH